MEVLLAAQKTQTLHKGEHVEATIINLSKKGVSFNIGRKAQAMLGQEEL